jgi:uncharacterized protein (DUF2267 family)
MQPVANRFPIATITVYEPADQRIMEGEAENIASQLPEPLGQLLTEEREEAEAFSIDEFVDWVQRRENEEGNVDRAGTVDHIVV